MEIPHLFGNYPSAASPLWARIFFLMLKINLPIHHLGLLPLCFLNNLKSENLPVHSQLPSPQVTITRFQVGRASFPPCPSFSPPNMPFLPFHGCTVPELAARAQAQRADPYSHGNCDLEGTLWLLRRRTDTEPSCILPPAGSPRTALLSCSWRRSPSSSLCSTLFWFHST